MQHLPIDSGAYSEWFLNALNDAEIFDYSPVRGCMVIRPYGYAIWELIQQELDKKIKAAGVKNAYFPLFIPESFLVKEKKHIEGFSPELAVVTHAGGEQLEEPLVVRPTSETIIYHMFSRWIKTHRDLPMKVNQWANVVRWEKRTKPFLRTSEFLWQEGHTAHQSEEEALAAAHQWLQIYVDFAKEILAIPGRFGEKTASEKFAGAKHTFTVEMLMRDGKALQSCTSHLLEHSFPEAFGVKFATPDGQMATPWCTSFGSTTRFIGAAIMAHGTKDEGFILPPKIAPVQVAIIPIRKKSDNLELMNKSLETITNALTQASVRFEVLDDAAASAGSRFFQAEKMGIPFRIEFGERDIASNQVVIVPRLANFFDNDKKRAFSLSELASVVPSLLDQFQLFLFDRAKSFLEYNSFKATSFEDLSSKLSARSAFYELSWCGGASCEATLKNIQATFRVISQKDATPAPCFSCSSLATIKAIAAKSY